MQKQLLITTLITCMILPIKLPGIAQEITQFPGVNNIKFDKIQSISAEVDRNVKLEKAILQNSPGYKNFVNSSKYAQYYYNKIDLNGDKKPEIIVHLVGSYFCGTGGCNTLIFQTVGDNYRLISRMTVTRLPIIVTPQKTAGWHNLIIYSAGGGAKPNYHVLKFNGKEYPRSPYLGEEIKPNATITGKALMIDAMQCLRSDRCDNPGIILKP